MTTWLTSWRLALRLARRDLLRNRVRAVIALIMVTLPVFGVVAADVLIQTAKVTPAEGVDRVLGTAATAEVQVVDDRNAVTQGADPQRGAAPTDHRLARRATLADIERVIGKRTTLAAVAQSEVLVRTVHGREPARADQVRVTAPLAQGLYRLTSGRWPRSTDEVVVNQALRDRGVGDTLTVFGPDRTEAPHRIVGTIRDASTRSDSVVVGLPGAFPAAPADQADQTASTEQAWLVDGPPITWRQVEALNRLGVVVRDRHILSHPGDYPDPFPSSSGLNNTTAQVGALIVVMALIEVVLLAGPSFAVGARKQQRALALLVSCGGTPAQARRVIIAGGLLLGVTAAVVGVATGIGAARLLQPVVQRFNGQWFGPFDVDWPLLAAVAAFGLVSALVACLVPAWIASRQNVVAVLAGRRGDAKPVRAFPWLGLVLFGIGVLMAAAGSHGNGTLTVAWSAVVCVLGMVLLVPAVIAWVAKAAPRFPLPVRFAARDAVRHRTRTTPAVAAVAATVAGVVALGIATASDAKQNREAYRPTLLMGDAIVRGDDQSVEGGPGAATAWSAVAAAVRQQVPGVRITAVRGADQEAPDGSFPSLFFRDPAQHGDDAQVQPVDTFAGIGTSVLVSDGSGLAPTVAAALTPADRVPQALAAGRAVVFTGTAAQTRLTTLRLHVDETDTDGNVTPGRTMSVPAKVVYRRPGDPRGAPVMAILPPSIAQQAGLTTTTVGLELSHIHLTTGEQKNLDAQLRNLPTPATVDVERGYQPGAFDRALQWVLALLAAVLMLGGTLTAMFLALADARPDLATLAAVGAEPRTRRTVAAAYTFVVAFVGAVLGMAVGFVPGLAIARPLTRGYGAGVPAYCLDVPWLMIAVVVVGLPLLAAAIVAVCTRSRLPMVSRLT